MCMQVVSAFFLQREKNGIVEKVKTRMKHILVFLFLSVFLRKGAFLLGKKSVPFCTKVRSFSKNRPYLLREKSASFLQRARSSSLELLFLITPIRFKAPSFIPHLIVHNESFDLVIGRRFIVSRRQVQKSVSCFTSASPSITNSILIEGFVSQKA